MGGKEDLQWKLKGAEVRLFQPAQDMSIIFNCFGAVYRNEANPPSLLEYAICIPSLKQAQFSKSPQRF
jgi:hypothetical protein